MSSDNLPERMEYAKALASSDLLPKQYRGHPANVLVAVEYGAALGIAPMAAIQGVHVVEGRPTASAQLIGALVRNAGHRLRVTGDDQHATATIIRRDDTDFTFTATWTIARAAKAGLTGKGVWKSYPAAMLKARAITEVARDACPEVLAGVAYTEEELGADTFPTQSAPPPVPPVVTTTRPPAAPAQPVHTPVDEPEVWEAEVIDDPAPPTEAGVTQPQLRKIMALCNELHITDRDMRLAYACDTIGRQIDSANDLTKGEAHLVIESLEHDVAATPADVVEPEQLEADG